LIMIQGYSADMTGWNNQIPALKKHFQLVVFDNRGVGNRINPRDLILHRLWLRIL
jgi:pimeloyl-ACP methyl ester carboxylesterase